MLTMKDIIREGHQNLRKKAKEVAFPMADTDKKALFDMMELVKNSQNIDLAKKYQLRPGVGLAAPQINILKKMVAIHTTDEKNEKIYSYMLVNPKIISHSEEMTYIQSGEGCLSVDREILGYVLRYKRIRVKAFQLHESGELTPINLRLKGYIAVVFQHEIDHLNGILFMDRINNVNPLMVDPNINPIEFS